jgi:hypothetical protein
MLAASANQNAKRTLRFLLVYIVLNKQIAFNKSGRDSYDRNRKIAGMVWL